VSKIDLSGRQLGDYQLERKFAAGGMAQIYLGIDQNLGRQAAVKVLTPEILEQDSTLAQRFEREARAVAQLEHDNIIPIYQYGNDDDLYFLAMRFIDGRDLSQLLEEYTSTGKLMPISRALGILEQVASALDHAHKYGIIHRDVKPSNVLIGSDDKTFLSDFGLVLWQSVEKTMGTAFGTPRYISPEQATDSEQSVPQSDIYSLAVMVYEIMTGQSLFTGNTPMEVALAHITETPKPPRSLNPNIPPSAQIEVLKALQKEPTERHQTALEFINALKRAYASDPSSTQALRFPSNQTPIIDNGSTQPVKPDTVNTKPLTPKDPTQDHTPTMVATDIPSKPVIERATISDVADAQTASQPANSNNLALYVSVVAVLIAVVAIIFALVFTGGGNTVNTEETEVAIAANNTVEAELAQTEQSVTLQAAIEQTNEAENLNVPTETLLPTEEPTTIPTEEPTAPPTDIPVTDVPTEIPTEIASTDLTDIPTRAPVVITGDVSLRFVYNSNLFAIINTAQTITPIDGMTFASASDADTDTFTNDGDLGLELNSGACLVIKSSSARDAVVPDAWGCNPERETTLAADNIFWFADNADDQQFTLTIGDAVLASCETAGRAVRRLDDITCDSGN